VARTEARRLFRFDDLCPTMNWKMWDRVERLLDENSIQPILALIPENADPKMQIEPANGDFWARARAWEAKGWVVGQHGYRHLYDSTDPGLVPWWRQSEFAGHTRSVQRQRLEAGRARMLAEGLRPRVWVAPSHSFDDTTLDVLRELDFEAVSDGFGYRSFRDPRGLVWVPLRPWEPPRSASALRTLCFHHNTLSDLGVLERAIHKHKGRSMGVTFRFEELVSGAAPKTLHDEASERVYATLFAGRRLLRRLTRRRRAS
jgi:peptidoglycan/xylan/chitin deacetylase (PgdA/CDA1 family)